MKREIALFDFDGTITTKDTLIEFIKFYKGKFSFYMGMLVLSPVLALYAFKLIPNFKAKEILLTHFFKNTTLDEFIEKCDRFNNEILSSLIKKEALQKIQWHKENNHRVVIVSASISYWIEPWTRANNLELIASTFEVKDDKLTGKLHSKNCFGPEKVVRIKECVRLDDYEVIYAYGDTKGDLEMLNLAHHKFYRHFNQ